MSSNRLHTVDPRGDVILAHDPNAGPVTAVKNIVIQSSIAQLRARGHYERYCDFIAPEVRDDLLNRIAPSWVPIDLAIAHYNACDQLGLSQDEINALGASVGVQVSDVVLVSRARNVRDDLIDSWTTMSQLHRVWPRVYQGGSVQVLRVGPKEQLIEQRGFVLNRFAYFRFSQIMTMRVTHAAVGIHIESQTIERYSPGRDELVYRLFLR